MLLLISEDVICIAGPGDKVCYYYGAKPTQYEELGHAEVVQMELRGESAQTRRQMEAFADTYFGQFRKTPFGMMRLDPQDSGPAYRNVIGIPSGTDSPLFQVLKVIKSCHCRCWYTDCSIARVRNAYFGVFSAAYSTLCKHTMQGRQLCLVHTNLV